MQRGFTFIEVITVVALILIASSITFVSFYSLNEREALNTTTAQVQSVLQEARDLTLASTDDVQYGVHIDSDGLVRFAGDTYTEGESTNVEIPVHALVTLTPTLSGGGSDVVFQRLTGETSQTGTITIELTSDASQNRTITIGGAGIVN